MTCAVYMGQANTIMEKSGSVLTLKGWRWIIESRTFDPPRARALRCLRTEMAVDDPSLIVVLGRSWMKLYLTRCRVCAALLRNPLPPLPRRLQRRQGGTRHFEHSMPRRGMMMIVPILDDYRFGGSQSCTLIASLLLL